MTTIALYATDTMADWEYGYLTAGLAMAREQDPDLIGPGELSMGMSGDYEIAVEEGAECVRVGQAIFGARALPDSHYWPGVAGTDDKTQG